MSVSNPDSRQKSNQPNEDRLDRWQYRLFKVVLFVIAVWAMWKFLNEHVPVAEALRGLVRWISRS
jgi:hypothetical protein